MLGEALRAVTALEQEGLTCGNLRQGALQFSGLAGKNERREPGQLLLDLPKRILIRIDGHLLDLLVSPAVRRPTLAHYSLPSPPRLPTALVASGPIHESFRRRRVLPFAADQPTGPSMEALLAITRPRRLS
jgi:hypothetical protein